MGPADNEVNRQRRQFVWSAVAAFLLAWFIAFFRFFLLRTLFEPATSFKIGYPSDYGLGVDNKISAEVSHLGRSHARPLVHHLRPLHPPRMHPRLETGGEQIAKCPCHGSGYDSEGINFEASGAAAHVDRAHVEIAPDGQILVDVAKLYQWPKGQPSGFNDPGAYLPG